MNVKGTHKMPNGKTMKNKDMLMMAVMGKPKKGKKPMKGGKKPC
jgi:hypothetical protein